MKICRQDDSQYDIYNPLITNDAVSPNKIYPPIHNNAAINIDLMKNLTWRTSGSYMWQQIHEIIGMMAVQKLANLWRALGSRDNSEKYSWQITNTLNWKKTFGYIV